MSQEEAERDPLHIGNILHITSDAYGDTVGRVVYRSTVLLRIMPQDVTDRATSFTMTKGGAAFAPDLGVTAIEIVEEQESNYYVDLLSAQVGETLEFFTETGDVAAESGVVAAVIKEGTEDDIVKDNIKLVDGRTLRFYGVGPKAPIAVIRVLTDLVEEAEQGQEEKEDKEEKKEREEREEAKAKRHTELMALFRSVLPSATVEAIPTAERSYPDSMQREDMFQDLLSQVSEKQRTNQRRIHFIEREVDLAVSLKNKSILRDSAGHIIGPAPYMITTIQEALSAQGQGLPAAIPIVEAALVLNLDQEALVPYKATDLSPRLLENVEQESEAASEGADTFYPFMYDLLSRGQAVLSGPSGKGWTTDQDVIRTAGPQTLVEGLSSDLPVDPYSTIKDVPPVTMDFKISNVKERAIRVLSGDTATNRKTGASYIIGPSDPSNISGHIMLPPKAALQLRPPQNPRHLPTALIYSAALQADNLPTIARTIYDSASNVWILGQGQEVDVAEPIVEWLEAVLRYAVHPIDSQGPRSPSLLSLLDTMGLAESDMSPAVGDVIWTWVRQSQATWQNLLTERRKTIQAAIDTEVERTFQSVTDTDADPAGLWAALRAAISLKELIEDIGRRNPTITGAPTLLTSSLLTEAQGDATPLVWAEIAKLDAREFVGMDPVVAAAALAASRAYVLRRKVLRDHALLELRASPEINPCPHVKRLEAVRNVGDPRLLRGFIEEFQGPKSGEWMTCVLCQANCVCYHELMQLEALASSGRGRAEAIQKQILIKFGGERYEGKIVCKNCGQSLQDIDYDDRVEFDDAGRAIVTASVLTAEQLEEPTETAWKKATIDLGVAEVSFAIPSQRALGEILNTIATEGRLQIPPATMKQIVRYADIYVSVRAPSADAWEAVRAKIAKAGKKKVPEPYSVIIARLQVTSLIALTAVAIQCAEVPIIIKNPLNECPYSRGGYPLDPSAKPTEAGALLYMACVTAFIQRAAEPWPSMEWANAKLESRRTKALDGATAALQIILGASPDQGPLPFTPEIRQALEKTRTDVVTIRQRALVSLTDRLPQGFRPDPFPPAMTRPSVEHDPIPAIVAALASNSSVAAMFGPVSASLQKQAIAIVGELHLAATESVHLSPEAVRLSPEAVRFSPEVATCCTVSFADANSGALLGQAEQAKLIQAGNLLRDSIPTSVSAGTHLWAAFVEPLPVVIEQTIDESIFYKLFLKYCYAGPRVGEAHEFSVGNLCRQCGLALGKPADLIDFTKEGAAILAAQQGDLRIEITAARFNALSETVRAHKIMGMKEGLVKEGSWIEAVGALQGLAPLEDFNARLTEVLNQGSVEGPVEEIERITAWLPIATLMDELRATLTAKVNLPKFNALGVFDAMTEDPFIEGPRAIQEYWCAKAFAAGNNYRVTKGKWGPLARKHKDMMDKLVSDNATWFGGHVTEGMKNILMLVARTLGAPMSIWIQLVRPSPSLSPSSSPSQSMWTVGEAQLLLRTLVLQVWSDSLTSTSWMYSSVGSVAEREEIVAGLTVWTRSLMQHVKLQFVKFSKETIKRILQDRAGLERDTIVEEFASIKDDDQKAAELIKKQFRIGRWAGGKNLQKYDADTFEFENEQRKRMGIMDPPIDPILIEGAPLVVPEVYVQEEGYAVEQEAEGDDY